jgi:sigma-E factor negative regulatory protein RseB
MPVARVLTHRAFLVRGAALLWAATAVGFASAQAVMGPTPAKPPEARFGPDNTPERSVSEWLTRMHEASRQRNYVGTFVVSSNAGSMSSARIWHACDGQRQVVERIESLSGTPRTTFRRDDEVLTFLPESRTVRREKRDTLGLFTDLGKESENAIPELYAARQVGVDRVAGFDADVVHVQPRDQLRFGYRIWSEKKSGLVMKVQTLDPEGHVLEQSAFSELQLDAPVRLDKLTQLMNTVPAGWKVEKSEAQKTTAEQEGWTLREPVAGFRPLSCYKRQPGVLQWIFSDGLASVSLFVESFDRRRHAKEGLFASGATHTLTRKVQDWWLTAVGEVPPQTLKAFSLNLERRR